jgi:hypothetical protein
MFAPFEDPKKKPLVLECSRALRGLEHLWNGGVAERAVDCSCLSVQAIAVPAGNLRLIPGWCANEFAAAQVFSRLSMAAAISAGNNGVVVAAGNR